MGKLACEVEPDLFYPEGYLGNREPDQTVETDPLPDYHSEDAERARSLCAECPFSIQCLEIAKAIQPEYGIFAGLDPDQIMNEVAKDALLNLR